jgi:hypothetical protein
MKKDHYHILQDDNIKIMIKANSINKIFIQFLINFIFIFKIYKIKIF